MPTPSMNSYITDFCVVFIYPIERQGKEKNQKNYKNYNKYKKFSIQYIVKFIKRLNDSFLFFGTILEKRRFFDFIN